MVSCRQRRRWRRVRWVRDFSSPFVCGHQFSEWEWNGRDTYVSITVECVVGQFDFVENDRLRLPVWAKCRTVRMNEHSLCTLWLRAASRNPLCAREFVTTIADRCHFKYHTIVWVLLQTVERNAKRWKHSSAKKLCKEQKGIRDELWNQLLFRFVFASRERTRGGGGTEQIPTNRNHFVWQPIFRTNQRMTKGICCW